jgi:hypothetical protein
LGNIEWAHRARLPLGELEHRMPAIGIDGSK